MLVVPEKEPRLGSSSARLVATCGQLVAKAKEKGQGNYSPDLRFRGWDDWIRTSDLTVPNRARYQTVPPVRATHPSACGSICKKASLEVKLLAEGGLAVLIIERPQYLEQLVSRRDNGRVKIITGIRRCGKSFLLFNLFRQYLIDDGVAEEQIVEIALDEVRHARLRNPFELDSYIRARVNDGSKRHYVLIDEIQFSTVEPNPYTSDPDDVITFVDAVLGLQRLPNVDLYVTGSNSRMLSSDILTQFEDRGDEVRLRPLCFSEFLPACDDRDHALRDYLVFGGMPRILAEQGVEDKSRYLKELFSETYLRDVIDRNGIRGERETLDTLLDFVASSVGSLTNPTKLSNRFKSELRTSVGHSTIDAYLGYFEEAFLLERVRRFDVKGGAYFKTPSKYYFADPGLRNARLNFRQVDENHLIENVVYCELARRGFNVDVGVVPFSTWVDEDGARRKKTGQLEVDFVANQVSRRYYVQVALGVDDPGKYEQETGSLRRIGDSFRKVVVVRDDIVPWHDEHGVLFVGLERFLLDERAIDL